MARPTSSTRWRFKLAALLLAAPLTAIVISALAGAFGPAVRVAVLVLGALAVLAVLAIVADLVEYGRRSRNDDRT